MRVLIWTVGALALGCSPNMVEVDLSESGLSATMQAPEGATLESKPLGVEVTAEQFELSVWDRPRDVDEERARGGEDRYTLIVDETDAVLLEHESMGGPYYFATVNVQVGGATWSCATDPLGHVDDKSAGMRMIEACRTLQAK